ncbi:MAG TPA: hypothetical protein VFS15_07940 [Kofleriaceae bacterium]|nr:hypothetical protein [Kofleriaceae bacterium]
MRILPAALAISAAIHGGAVAWVSTRSPPNPELPRPVTIAPIEVVPPEPPTEVTLLDDHTVVAAAPTASPARHTRPGNARHEIVASRGRGTETAQPSAEPPHGESPQPPHNRYRTMRHPTIEKGPSDAFWDKFAANTKPLQPKDIASEQRADELASAEAHLGNPRWIANASPDQVAAERVRLVEKRYEQAHAELRPDGAGTKAEHQTFRARFNPDGTIAALDDKANLQRKGLGASFDVSDAIMRSKGIDPYSSYKLKVLDETRDERVAIGKRYRTQQLAQSRQHMQKNLARLWATTHDLAARKQGLFELWDDCAETGSAELVAGGTSARTYLIGVIRAKLPAGSTEAFTADELARLNKQRRSRAAFRPYD